jgi:hypothetical protein
MVYVDTSALVPMFFNEAGTDTVLAWIEASGERLAISDWTLTEFASAAAMKVRARQAPTALARQAVTRCAAFADARLLVAVPGRAEFRRAAALAGDAALELRAGDALHLAIAEAAGASALLVLDRALAAAARAIGLNVVAP